MLPRRCPTGASRGIKTYSTGLLPRRCPTGASRGKIKKIKTYSTGLLPRRCPTGASRGITVQNTKNRSIRKAFQYKSTVKPVIICVMNSDKRLNIPFEVRRSKVQSVRHAVFPLDKTTICTRSTISSPIILRFTPWKLSSIP